MFFVLFSLRYTLFPDVWPRRTWAHNFLAFTRLFTARPACIHLTDCNQQNNRPPLSPKSGKPRPASCNCLRCPLILYLLIPLSPRTNIYLRTLQPRFSVHLWWPVCFRGFTHDQVSLFFNARVRIRFLPDNLSRA